MFKKVKPYMGSYAKYTYTAALLILAATAAGMIPYYLIYRIIRPLTDGDTVSAGFLAGIVALTCLCLVIHAVLYALGLRFSHIAAYNTLKNLRCSMQEKIEKQPLGTIREKGNGKIKTLFTDDIEQVELLLAHAIPEGIANLVIALIALICMFIVDWKLALLSLCSLPLGMFAMGMMFKSGIQSFISSSEIPALSLLPASQFPLPACEARLLPLLPIGLLPEVQNGMTVLPSKSCASTNVLMILGASPHQIGYPM